MRPARENEISLKTRAESSMVLSSGYFGWLPASSDAVLSRRTTRGFIPIGNDKLTIFRDAWSRGAFCHLCKSWQDNLYSPRSSTTSTYEFGISRGAPEQYDGMCASTSRPLPQMQSLDFSSCSSLHIFFPLQSTAARDFASIGYIKDATVRNFQRRWFIKYRREHGRFLMYFLF